MKTRTLLAALALFTASATSSLFGMETYYVVEIRNFDKSEEYKIMSKDEYSQLSMEIRNESKLFSKAIAAAEKAWKEDPLQGKQNYPKSAVAQRAAKIKKQTTNSDEASKIASKLEDNKNDSAKRKQESLERKYKVNGNDWDPMVRNEKAMKEALRAKDEAEQAEKDKLLESAKAIFIEQITKLIEQDRTSAPAPAVKADPQPASK